MKLEILRINRLQKVSTMHTLLLCFFEADIPFLPSLNSPPHSLPMAAAKPNSSSLPPYTEMIYAAIDSLKGKEGSSESSISEYIESTCENLPDDHVNILTDNLNKLVESGELVVVNDSNYMRPETTPDTTEPPKRGRGRPPKPKDTSVSENPAPTGSEVKRGRGRPKKDPNAPSSAKKVKVASPPSSTTGRGRGRPRKVQPELTTVEAN